MQQKIKQCTFCANSVPDKLSTMDKNKNGKKIRAQETMLTGVSAIWYTVVGPCLPEYQPFEIQ